MSNKPAIPVKTTLVKQFNRTHGRFLAASNKAAPEMVKAINHTRTMGILVKELLGRDNITENCLAGWLRDNPGALAETQVGWLMNFVRISNKMQGELKLFGDAPREVVQMTMQCAGLLPPDAGRDGEQFRHEVTPVAMTWKCLADLRIRFEGLPKNSRTWDDETRSVVIRNIEKTEAFLEELKQQISSPEMKRIGVSSNQSNHRWTQIHTDL